MRPSNPTNATIVKFGYPDSVVKEYSKWLVLARPEQVTLGSLVLACKESAKAFSDIGGGAFQELGTVTRDIESCLGELWSYDRINYLMLMMVDPDVHFHVIPRYDSERTFGGLAFRDGGWPRLPDFGDATALGDGQFRELVSFLRQHWPEKV